MGKFLDDKTGGEHSNHCPLKGLWIFLEWSLKLRLLDHSRDSSNYTDAGLGSMLVQECGKERDSVGNKNPFAGSSETQEVWDLGTEERITPSPRQLPRLPPLILLRSYRFLPHTFPSITPREFTHCFVSNWNVSNLCVGICIVLGI